MITLSKLIPVIIRFLSKQLPKLPIYSHIPSIAVYPLLQLARIEQEPWYAIEDRYGCILTLVLECWSSAESSKEIILLTDKLMEVILKSGTELRLEAMQIFSSLIDHRQVIQSDKGDLWRGNVRWKLWLGR